MCVCVCVCVCVRVCDRKRRTRMESKHCDKRHFQWATRRREAQKHSCTLVMTLTQTFSFILAKAINIIIQIFIPSQ